MQVVKELSNAGSRFRVLALSATPGNDLKVGLLPVRGIYHIPSMIVLHVPFLLSLGCAAGRNEPSD